MTSDQLKKLEDKLWDSANSLRAYGGLKASDYAVPVLGIIFLRFADNKYTKAESDILKEYEQCKGTRMEKSMEDIAVGKCGFFLPEKARYEYLLNLPGDKKAALAVKEAMEAIESHQDATFGGVLPKDAYFDIEKKKGDIIPQLLKTFSDIPKDASGDIFGKIYEYFLGKFALSEGQKGGEFFTPTSVVRFIVEVIEPFAGKIFDPACGSGGMFVQSAKFVQNANHDLNDIYVCGQEFMGETVRLAKMNLLVNNIRGEITEVNSYEGDPYKSKGKFDFVMANPPFNVKTVKESTVKGDERFTAFGLPKTQGNKDDKITDANYLWVSLFASSLNDRGRAGFVMANSASDARNSEYEIRKRIVDAGIVDCMVTMPSNMFYTVTLPATIWFFDKGKVKTDRKDKILFLDGRNVYRQINRAQREWTEEQVQNLSAIIRLYRGETERYLELIAHYIREAQQALITLPAKLETYLLSLETALKNLHAYSQQFQENKLQGKEKEAFELLEQLATIQLKEAVEIPNTERLIGFDATLKSNTDQLQFAQASKDTLANFQSIALHLKAQKENLITLWKKADSTLKLKNDKDWVALQLNRLDKVVEEPAQALQAAIEQVQYWYDTMNWLQERFPEASYIDITGLCKAASLNEYVEEQDYSLNPGRYVGVEVEGDNLPKEEFNLKLGQALLEFEKLTLNSSELERNIIYSIKELINVLG